MPETSHVFPVPPEGRQALGTQAAAREAALPRLSPGAPQMANLRHLLIEPDAQTKAN